MYATPTVPEGSVGGDWPLGVVITRGVVTAASVRVSLPILPVESVAVIVAGKDPGWVGVPTMNPDVPSIFKPGGSPEAVQAYGAVPPVAKNDIVLFPLGGSTYVEPTINWKLDGA